MTRYEKDVIRFISNRGGEFESCEMEIIFKKFVRRLFPIFMHMEETTKEEVAIMAALILLVQE